MAVDTLPVFTINHFPDEIIERFAPDLRPRTISTLRLVSRRFRDLFTADRYYRSYLCYPDRPGLYRHDLEEVGDEEGRWRRCLVAEKRRLDNWRNGRFKRVDNVEIPASARRNRFSISNLKGLIDEDNEHWMLLICFNNKIILMNYTEEPILTVHDMSSYNIPKYILYAAIAPGQVVIGLRGILHVFKYLKNGDNVSLEYYFKITDTKAETVIMSGRSDVGGHKNLLYNYEPRGGDGMLRVWDIKQAKELESLSLRQFTPLREYIGNPTCSVTVLTSRFPNAFVLASFPIGSSSNSSAVAIVNVEERQLTYFIGRIENLESHHFCFSDSCVGLVTYNINKGSNTLKLYERCVRPPSEPKVIFKFEHDTNPIWPRFIGTTLIIDIPPFDERERDLWAIHIDGSEIIQSKIEIPEGIKNQFATVHTIIGQFWIFRDSSSKIFKTFDEHGKELFDWETKLQENKQGHGRRLVSHKTLSRAIEYQQTLFKCVVHTEDGNMVIFNF